MAWNTVTPHVLCKSSCSAAPMARPSFSSAPAPRSMSRLWTSSCRPIGMLAIWYAATPCCSIPRPVQYVKTPRSGTPAQVSPPAQTASHSYQSQPRQRTTVPATSATAAALLSTPAGESVTVRPGDTAGRIAGAHRLAGVSLDQMLVAMLQSNPHAFIDGNVNRIRAGTVIKLPTRRGTKHQRPRGTQDHRGPKP